MTNDKDIFIKNVYYMLSYAFRALRQDGWKSVAAEDFASAQDLLAAILAKATAQQLKQGLHRKYVTQRDMLPVRRGKIDLPETVCCRTQCRPVMACEFDELSEDNLFNRILKTTLTLLLRDSTVSDMHKAAMRRVLRFLDGVAVVQPAAIPWTRLQYRRDNQNYEMLMGLCQLVLAGMLQTTENGTHKLAMFDDAHMERLYEKFILEYYRRHHSYLSEIKASQVPWNLTGTHDAQSLRLLPVMKTDVLLRQGEKILIIDAKYYGQIMQRNFDKPSLRSAHLYQIYAYVSNADRQHTGNVSGLLVYAKTQEELLPDCMYNMGGNHIGAVTLDLSRDFSKIAAQLDAIAARFVERGTG